MSDHYFQHQELIKRTKLLTTKVFVNSLRIFDRHIGMFFKRRIDKDMVNYTPVKINRKGMADNWGVIICYSNFDICKKFKIPIHFEVESKTGKAILNKDQIIWKDFCESLGIWWFENRDENKLIKDIIEKASSCNLTISEINYGGIRN